MIYQALVLMNNVCCILEKYLMSGVIIIVSWNMSNLLRKFIKPVIGSVGLNTKKWLIKRTRGKILLMCTGKSM